ncbi:hypothetical protein FRB90_011078, partial [Tulasnella sp. 427]
MLELESERKQRNATTSATPSTPMLDPTPSIKHNDFSLMRLKADHASRPLWFNPEDATIILEGLSPIAERVQDFLVAISEPVSRQSFMHEYRITPYSLYAAVSVGLDTDNILSVLARLSKTPLPDKIVQLIKDRTMSYGKVKLVLRRNKYYVESANPNIFQMLLADPVTSSALVNFDPMGQPATEHSHLLPRTAQADSILPTSVEVKDRAEGMTVANPRSPREWFASVMKPTRTKTNLHSFQVSNDLKQRCLNLNCPLLEEYDFRNDTVNPKLDIDLKPLTVIRPYQEKCLGKMFGNGRARSGIIVLPCGAGKSLVGVTAACTIKKSCLVLCTSGVSVLQWQQQFLQWSNIHQSKITVFTSDSKPKMTDAAGIVVSTYSMVAHTGRRSLESKRVMELLTSREWGLVILDEVHVVPADIFSRVITTVKAHLKLGLTATLVREDDRIEDLNYMIGPKL